MLCENCGTMHEGTIGSGRFCSISCGRSFSTKAKRAEINAKVSAALKGRPGHSKEVMAVIAKKVSDTRKEMYANMPFDELALLSKKKRILNEQDGKCISCGLSHWLDQPIKFELDHVDGDKKNNGRENLRVMCPNCHSLTPTWRKKKIFL